MPHLSSDGDGPIGRSHGVCDKARNERQKNVLLTTIAKVRLEESDELTRNSSDIRAKSKSLLAVSAVDGRRCQERGRLLTRVIQLTSEYSAEVENEVGADTPEQLAQLKVAAVKARQELQKARLDLATHKNEHGCGFKGK